jgi:hypothetical protein
MVINTACARFAHTDHNGYIEAASDLKQQILNQDSAKGSRELFLQGMAGVKIKVKFPFMKDFEKGKIVAINDAVLELNNAESDTTHAPPATLALIKQDSAGRVGYLVDEGEGTSYFGGYYNASSRSYFFRITQHMQNVMQGDYTKHFELYVVVNNPIKSVITPNRVVLNGTDPLNPAELGRRLRLKVTYTVLN